MTERELRRIPLKEEFVAITGHHVKAIILAQLEYWQKRAREFDKFIEEEKDRISKEEGLDINLAPTHGWIYKSAQELSRETMLGQSKSSIRSHLKDLVTMGYVLERPNPFYKWDKTMQYRLDLIKIRDDLNKLGYELQDWIIDITPRNHTSSKIKHRKSKNTTQDNDKEYSKESLGGGIDVSPHNHTSSEIEHRESKNNTSMFQNRTAITEITSEITNRDYKHPPYNPPLTHEVKIKQQNKKNIRVHKDINKNSNKNDNDTGNIREELRKAIYRHQIFEIYDNLVQAKSLQQLVKEGAFRACKDIIVNRTRFLTENGLKVEPSSIAEEIQRDFPYKSIPSDKEKKRGFFVAAVCDLTANKIAGMIGFERNSNSPEYLHIAPK